MSIATGIMRFSAMIVLIASCLPPTPAIAADPPASQPVLTIRADAPQRNVGRYAYYLKEADALAIEEIRRGVVASRFRPVDRSEPDFGYSEQPIWLRLRLRNESDQRARRVILLKTNFMVEIDAWLGSATGVEHVLDDSTARPFWERDIAYHHLATRIDLPPAGTATLWIRYRSSGSTALPIDIETPNSFVVTVANTMATDFVFYGIMMVFTLAGLGATLIVPRPIFLAYCLYAGTVLLYIFQRDGYAFQYLWPGAPGWNECSSLPLGALLPFFAAHFTRTYLDTREQNPVADRILVSIMAIQFPLVGAAFFIDVSLLKQLAVLITTAASMTFLATGLIALRRQGRRMLFFVLGWLGIVLASSATFGALWLGFEITREQMLNTMRAAMVFDAFMMGLAVVAGVVDLRRERDLFMRERVAALRKNLELHKRLARLEQNYDLAHSLAEANSRLLADTSHDLRQPIFALRAALGELVSDPKPNAERTGHVEQSLQYMEQLVDSVLDRATAEDEFDVAAADQIEDLPASVIISTIAGMYAAEAGERAVELRAVPSTAQIRANPLVVLRIMGNLVTNAIHYAAGSRVLVGARRNGSRLSLEVHDCGPGMAQPELERVRARSIRGSTVSADAAGKGLGLAIIADLAAANGFLWSLESTPGRGTVARLSVPIAEAVPAVPSNLARRTAGEGIGALGMLKRG